MSLGIEFETILVGIVWEERKSNISARERLTESERDQQNASINRTHNIKDRISNKNKRKRPNRYVRDVNKKKKTNL